MRTRNVIIGAIVVVVVLIGAATILILYMQVSKDGVIDEAILATVVVSKREIQTSQALDPLIEDGVIVEIRVPRYALVVGALTDIRQLRGSTAVSLIRKHEQISASNLVTLDAPA